MVVDHPGVQTQSVPYQTVLQYSHQRVDGGANSPADMASEGERRLVAEESDGETLYRETEYHRSSKCPEVIANSLRRTRIHGLG
jgi:hypothetical protein